MRDLFTSILEILAVAAYAAAVVGFALWFWPVACLVGAVGLVFISRAVAR